MSKSELKKFVDAGYKKKGEVRNVNGYTIDNSLSTRRNKVYVNPEGKVIHTIAGTDNMKDWMNNALIPLGLHKYSNRYKNSEKIQKQANEKYGKRNVNLVSHSQSGNIAESLANKKLVGGQNTSLNPAIIGFHNKKLNVVKSRADPVSLLTITNKNDKIIKPSSYNPLTEHSTKILSNDSTLRSNDSTLRSNDSTLRSNDLNGKGISNNNMSELKEQDIIDRIAKLSHDIHHHVKMHGMKPDITESYKILGKGIVHCMNDSDSGSESDDDRPMRGTGHKPKSKHVRRFNDWFKAIGQKFKPLNKNLSPIKHALTGVAVKKIKEYGESPSDQAKGYMDMFQKSTKTASKATSGKPTYNEMYEPRVSQPDTSYHYEDDTGLPSVPSYYDKSSTQPYSYESSDQAKFGTGLGVGIGKKLTKNLGKNAMKLSDAGTAYLTRKIDGGKIGRTMIKSLAKNAMTLADAGTSYGVKKMGGGGVKCVKGSPEMKERMRKMREMRSKK